MVKWTCKIVDFSRNCEMEMVVTCFTTDGNGSYHGLTPSFFEEMTRCRHKKLHWIPGKHNSRSKFHNLGLFTFTRSQLTLRGRLRGWWRHPEIAQVARNRRQKRRLDDWDRSNFRKYKNLCLRDQAKRLETPLFTATNDTDWWDCALFFFFAIIRNGLH